MSAPSSGHGKTAVAVGLLAAAAARGVPVAGFKIGPDYADAAYLGLAAGRPGRNLDPQLVGADRIGPLFAYGSAGAELAVIKGTMGLFDSLAGRAETESTATIAAALRAPVILVLDVSAMGQSVAALVHGFRAYDEVLRFGGVILNRVASERHEQLLREALGELGVPVLGALRRRDLPAVLPGRQHGLVPVAHRSIEATRAVRRLGEAVAAAVDLDRVLALARSAPRLPVQPWSPADGGPAEADGRPVIAVAGGPGAPYTYAETAELLTAAGATVAPVDPLRDEALPEGTAALVVGAGLPESYAEELSANRRLCGAVAELARAGAPVLAEGAGLLWLAREFDGRPMCGVLDATGVSMEQTVIGYREATARAATAVAQPGARLTGYKQHRGVLIPRAGQTPAWSWGNGAAEGFVWRRVHASQLALHWAGVPGLARRLVAAAAVPLEKRGPSPRVALPTARSASSPSEPTPTPTAAAGGRVPAAAEPVSPSAGRVPRPAQPMPAEEQPEATAESGAAGTGGDA
ncbi:cobyrinate a,c-diamide synthase [Micromonospora pattaloongensis]|uniref:cobyrinate a,c-diamide synthase n=1 Tax=Micromonospora pattaloongensis TaxID=405436 RepID=UPI001FE05F85|nr:cobyrinate a,c-diamide synthase [Micromonospora pattaloongensis]